MYFLNDKDARITELETALKDTKRILDNTNKWFAGEFKRIGVELKTAFDHEAKPEYLQNTRAETAEAAIGRWYLDKRREVLGKSGGAQTKKAGE